MAFFQPLPQAEEDALHRSRLLNIEEKPFKRVTRRLLAPGSLLLTPPKALPTPPPDSSDATEAESAEAFLKRQLDERRQFREDILLDFAAFDSSIIRIQNLHKSNQRERAEYAAKKERILKEAQKVKYDTAELRVQLEAAQRTMEQRKKFDELAEKITNNRLLRPRADQEVNLRKLEEECRELERESETYSVTWAERREQFGKIVEESLAMRRLIRNEKEEVERREGMQREEEDGEVGEQGEGSRGGQTPKHEGSVSGAATPNMDDNAAGENVDSRASPKPEGVESVRDRSPARSLRPRRVRGDRSVSREASRSRSRVGSRFASPVLPDEMEGVEGDSEMAESGAASEVVDGPVVTIQEPEEKNGDEEEGAVEEDKMDTT